MESDALVNAFFSFIIPGLGQAIEGYKVRAIILFVISVLMRVIFFYYNFDTNLAYLIHIIYGLIVAYDAYRLY